MSREDYAKAVELLDQLSLCELEDLQDNLDKQIEAVKVDNSSTVENSKYYCFNKSNDYYYIFSEGLMFISLEDTDHPWVNLSFEEETPVGNFNEVKDVNLLQKFKQLLEKHIEHKLQTGEEQISTWKEQIQKMKILRQTLG